MPNSASNQPNPQQPLAHQDRQAALESIERELVHGGDVREAVLGLIRYELAILRQAHIDF